MISTKVKPTSKYEDYSTSGMIESDYNNLKILSKEEALEMMLQDEVATVQLVLKLYHKSILEKTPFPSGKYMKIFM